MTHTNKRKYLKYMQAHEDWLPGWDAIKNAFDPVYGETARQFMPAGRIGETPTSLQGFALYASTQGYLHIVTCGLSQIGPARDACTAARSGLGFELTARCACATPAECMAVLRLLNRIALYADSRKCSYSLYSCFPVAERTSPDAASDALTAVAFIPDCSVPFLDSIHGRVDFLQVIDLTEGEWREIRRHPGLVRQVIFSMHQQDPRLLLNVARTGNYLAV